MAIAPTAPLVSVDEYLSTSYHPDREYIDGVLVERSVPTFFHALLQMIVGTYLRQFEEQYRFKVLPELRTQIIEGARYRIPDLLLCATPTPKKRIMTVPPLVVIEILSPDDKVRETLDRYGEYAGIGVPIIIQMDPEAYVVHRYEAGSLLATRLQGLYLPHVNATVPFDSDALFEQLRSEVNQATDSD
jgi:Uma2 family endonuclease